MSTFSTLTTVRLGIYAAQAGIDVTGNNITNISTSGYTRQALQQTSLLSSINDKYYSKFDPRIGQGVVVTGVDQLRDPALDITYRNAMSDVGSMDAKLAGLESLASIIDEVGKGDTEQDDGVILRQLNELRDVISRAVTDGIDGYDGIIKTSASSLVTLFNSYSAKLDELTTTYETYIEQDEDQVNTLLSEIQKLSISIRDAEIRGDQALELRDERNRMLDSLSQYVKINVDYQTETIGAGFEVEKLVVNLVDENRADITGGELIDGVYAAQITIEDSTNNYNVAVGELKNIDGDIKEISPGVFDTSTDLADTELYGSIQSLRELLTEQGVYASATDLTFDPQATEKMGIPYYQKALDQLAFEFAEQMNALNTPGTGITGEGNLFSNAPDGNNETNITAANISISASWADGTVQMLSTTDENASSGDTSNLARFLNVFSDSFDVDPKDIKADAEGTNFDSTLEELLLGLQSTLAEEQMSATTVLSNYAVTADNVYVAREGVMGVDLNDEATSLMKYQNAYSAAARLMTVFDEVLNTLIHS